MAITKITTPEVLDFPNDSISSANTSGTVIPTGNNYVSGGGGLVENSLTLAVSTTYTVTVGTGGVAGNPATSPTNGGDSTISGSFTGSPITATGGGSGNFSNNISNSGGSGAGAQGGDSRVYPTQKPLGLLERIVEMTTDEGDLVLDPMAGAGTTGLAAKNLNRQYILFDNNPDAIAIMKKRLEQT